MNLSLLCDFMVCGNTGLWGLVLLGSLSAMEFIEPHGPQLEGVQQKSHHLAAELTQVTLGCRYSVGTLAT